MSEIGSGNIEVELIFNSEAERFFRFPVSNPIRISFWEKESRYSNPCEISCEEEIFMNKISVAVIKFPIDYLKRTAKKGDLFYVGTFPLIIGQATVLKNLDVES